MRIGMTSYNPGPPLHLDFKETGWPTTSYIIRTYAEGMPYELNNYVHDTLDATFPQSRSTIVGVMRQTKHNFLAETQKNSS